MGRIRREEREREQEKANIQRRNRLKRGHQQKETNHTGSKKEEEVS